MKCGQWGIQFRFGKVISFWMIKESRKKKGYKTRLRRLGGTLSNTM